jgi:type I restriction enzyme R subunit
LSSLSESVVEPAALEWLATPDYAVLHGPEIAPGEIYAERQEFRQAVLDRRLGETLRAAQFGAAPRGAGRRLTRGKVGMKPELVRT